MKNLLMIICTVLLSISLMAQNKVTKTKDAKPLQFTIKKANNKTFLNTKMTTIMPAVKIAIPELKPKIDETINNEKLKFSPTLIKKD